MSIQLRQLPLTDLKPAPYNPRKPLRPGTAAWRRLERSLSEFDLVQPIVWNERTGHVVGGHQRVEILRHRGVTTVDVAVVDLPLEREKALNIALNNSLIGSEWDAGKLLELVSELAALPDFDATLTGFDEDDLRDLLLGPAITAPPAAEPATPDIVRITLEVLPEDWEEFRPALDTLLQQHPVRLHVRLPAA